MESTFVWFREKIDYQKTLTTLVAEVCRGAMVLHAVAIDLLVFPENHLLTIFQLQSGLLFARASFQKLVRERQTFFAGSRT